MSPAQAAEAARVTHIRRAGVALLMGGALLLTSACGSGNGGGKGNGGDSAASAAPNAANAANASAAPKVSAAKLTVTPQDGAQDVAPTDALQVTVASGTLTNVAVTDKDGKAVDGQISADGLSWKPSAALAVGTSYTVNAQAKDAAGLVAAATSSFTTLTPAKTTSVVSNISNNSTYGVGMIVSVTFNKPVKNKADVLKNITFDTSNNIQVKGHWFGSQRVDFRPETYWQPGTKVTVHYRLKNVEVSPGVYGSSDRDEPFTIGRSQISTADAATDMMTVQRNGATATTFPITTGDADHASWAGIMVISEKDKVTRMNSQTVGLGDEYDMPDVPHAMRLTDSGTFVHGNYWGNSFGKSNTSHGCVSMQDAKGGDDNSSAGKFYNSSLIGDVVKIVNAKGGQVAPDNGLSGWNLSWSNW